LPDDLLILFPAIDILLVKLDFFPERLDLPTGELSTIGYVFFFLLRDGVSIRTSLP